MKQRQPRWIRRGRKQASDRHTTDPRETRLTEATQEDWFWGRINTSGSEEDYYWRRLSDNWAHKDVLPATYLDIHNQCFEAYNANPMANAIIEMGTNFVLGDGLQIDARHKKVQALLDDFWTDPDNHMHLRQYDLATELALYGELFIRFFVNPFNGHVKIAQIDPILIDEIVCDPDNIERQLRCHRRATSVTGTTDTVPSPTDPGMRGQWFDMPAEVMHFAVNKVTNAKRGKSDLATLLPWLRRYKDWLIDRVRVNKYKSAFLWDVQLTGADRKTIEGKMMEYARPPEPGSVLVHNESEQWQAVQPMISADDVSADGKAIKIMIAMGAGLPEHLLSEGGDVNRATAAEMGLPVIKKYQRRQDYLGHILRSILDRLIAEAQHAGTLPRTIDTDYTIRFPALEPDDAQAQGTASFRMAQALAIGLQNGIVSRETASRIFFDYAREEVDANAERERLVKEGRITPDGSGLAPTA
ncbi:MAG TPA: hypothetical protein VKX16_12040 [Chloroflexota bacterium]|nr:hypothetical protein [Chloroflexota bacterium]